MTHRTCHCDRHVPGEPFARGRDCARCWRWHNDPGYRAGRSESPPGKIGHAVRITPGLGDEVEALIKAVGLDRLAKAYEQVTGRKCKCNQRRQLLNRLPAVLPAVRRLLGRD